MNYFKFICLGVFLVSIKTTAADLEAISIEVCLLDLQAAFGNILHDGTMDLLGDDRHQMQIITHDKQVLSGGAISAVVLPSGKVVQIMANGGCALSPVSYAGSVGYLARNLEQFNALPMIMKNKLARAPNPLLTENCSRLPTRPPYDRIRAVLVKGGVLKAPPPSRDESDGGIDVTE